MKHAPLGAVVVTLLLVTAGAPSRTRDPAHPAESVGGQRAPTSDEPRLRLPHAEAPPAGVTGGFGEATCVSCHIGNDINAYGGRVRLEGLPDAYEPGREYVLTVDLAAEETSVAGFQLAARFTDGPERGENAGMLQPVDVRTAISDSLGIRYLHQTPEGSRTRDSSGSSWSVAWSAPASGGRVALHLAANSGNGDNSPLGDLVYTSEAVVPAHGLAHE